MRLTRRAVTAGLAAAPAVARAQGVWTPPDDAAILALLKQRVDVEHRGVGIVAGFVTPKGQRVVAYGEALRGSRRLVNGRSVYEIGSMTKVFTSLLLAEAVRRGELKLDDPVAKFLPAEVHVPERGGRQITLIDLATHTSGLPRMPSNFAPKDMSNPYVDYGTDRLYAFLSQYVLTRDIGSQFEYSNLAVGLLGHALARHAGVTYEALVKQRITGPLGMADTVATLTPSLRARLAQGHDRNLDPASLWDQDALAGAGALRSTADDILTFLSAELGFKPSPLRAAMDAQRVPRRLAAGGSQTALAWQVRQVAPPVARTGDQLVHPASREVFWHNGGTGGYFTFMGFDPAAQVGCVVLSNTSAPPGVDDIGLHILAGLPVAPQPPLVVKTIVALSPEALDGLVGTYAIGPATLVITREDARLLAKLSGQAPLEVFPTSPTEAFYKAVDAQLSFERGPDGRATALTLHQNGRDVRAVRNP